MNEHTNIDYANMPSSYMMCFNTACPKAATCLHLMAGANLPATYTCGLAIYPNMQTGENGCKFFDEAQPKQMLRIQLRQLPMQMRKPAKETVTKKYDKGFPQVIGVHSRFIDGTGAHNAASGTVRQRGCRPA